MRQSTTLAMSALVILTLIVGAGNLWASWTEVHNAAAAAKREQVSHDGRRGARREAVHDVREARGAETAGG